MSANYQEGSVEGSKWIRAKRVEIDNPYGVNPKLVFSKELIVNLGVELGLVKKSNGTLIVNFDPSATFPLISPFTGEPMTNVEEEPLFGTHLDLYIYLHSLFIYEAVLANAEIVHPEEPEPDPPTD